MNTEERAKRAEETYTSQWIRCCWFCNHRVLMRDVDSVALLCGDGELVCDLLQKAGRKGGDEFVSPLDVCGEWEQEGTGWAPEEAPE